MKTKDLLFYTLPLIFIILLFLFVFTLTKTLELDNYYEKERDIELKEKNFYEFLSQKPQIDNTRNLKVKFQVNNYSLRNF